MMEMNFLTFCTLILSAGWVQYMYKVKCWIWLDPPLADWSGCMSSCMVFAVLTVLWICTMCVHYAWEDFTKMWHTTLLAWNKLQDHATIFRFWACTWNFLTACVQCQYMHTVTYLSFLHYRGDGTQRSCWAGFWFEHQATTTELMTSTTTNVRDPPCYMLTPHKIAHIT